MVNSVKPFVGAWTINWVSGRSPVQQQWQLLIGTGSTHGDFAPTLSPDYDVTVGFALLDGEGNPVLATGGQDQQLLPMMFTNGTLRCAGVHDDKPVRVYVSVADAQLADGTVAFSLYGTTTIGDPDQVGVWGADGNPASQPPPPSPHQARDHD